MRGWICRLQLLLGLASAVIFTAIFFMSFNTVFVTAIILSSDSAANWSSV
jgi:hypothetical protein